MHQQGVQGIADGGALHLGILGNGHRLGDVGGFIDIGVADADAAGHHRHGGMLGHIFNQPGAAAWYQQIDTVRHFKQVGYQRPVGVGHKLYRAPGHTGPPRPLGHDGRQHGIGINGFLAAAQDDGIARFQAENGDVHGDIGAALVDSPDHPQGDAAPP